MIFRLIIFGFLLLSFLNLNSQQQTKVKTSIDTNKILIGDQIKYLIKLTPDENEKVIFPQLNDSLGKFLIVSKTKLDTIIENKTKYINQTLILTSFDSGVYIIPNLKFGFISNGDTNFYLGDSYQIQVSTIDVDTTKPIKDIKPIMELPSTIMDYILYILLGIVVFAIALGVYYYLKNWTPKVKEFLPYDPKIPPHVQALKDLNELERQKLWQKGFVKEYYSRVSEILRLYLERRFNFLALESTTNEIMTYFTQIISSAEITKQLKEVLELSDLVKFAKFIPTIEEHTKIIDYARNIVQSTIPIESEENQEAK